MWLHWGVVCMGKAEKYLTPPLYLNIYYLKESVP